MCPFIYIRLWLSHAKSTHQHESHQISFRQKYVCDVDLLKTHFFLAACLLYANDTMRYEHADTYSTVYQTEPKKQPLNPQSGFAAGQSMHAYEHEAHHNIRRICA